MAMESLLLSFAAWRCFRGRSLLVKNDEVVAAFPRRPSIDTRTPANHKIIKYFSANDKAKGSEEQDFLYSPNCPRLTFGFPSCVGNLFCQPLGFFLFIRSLCNLSILIALYYIFECLRCQSEGVGVSSVWFSSSSNLPSASLTLLSASDGGRKAAPPHVQAYIP